MKGGNRKASSTSTTKNTGKKRRPQYKHSIQYTPTRAFHPTLAALQSVPRGNKKITIPSAQLTRQYNEMYGENGVRTQVMNQRLPTVDGFVERPTSSWSGFYSQSIDRALQPHAFLRHSLLGGTPRAKEQVEQFRPRSSQAVDDHHDFYKNADLAPPLTTTASPLRGAMAAVATAATTTNGHSHEKHVMTPPILNLRPFSTSTSSHEHRRHHRLKSLSSHYDEHTRPAQPDAPGARVQRQYDLDGNVDPVSEDLHPIDMKKLDVKPEAVREAQLAFKKTELETHIKSARMDRTGRSHQQHVNEDDNKAGSLHHKQTQSNSNPQDTGGFWSSFQGDKRSPSTSTSTSTTSKDTDSTGPSTDHKRSYSTTVGSGRRAALLTQPSRPLASTPKTHIPRRNDVAFKSSHLWTENPSLTRSASDKGSLVDANDASALARRIVGRQSIYSRLNNHDYAGAADLTKMGIGVNPDLDRYDSSHPDYPDSAEYLRSAGPRGGAQTRTPSGRVVRRAKQRTESRMHPAIERYLSTAPNSQKMTEQHGRKNSNPIHTPQFQPHATHDNYYQHIPSPVGGIPHKLKSAHVTKESRPAPSRRQEDFPVEYD